MLDLNYNAAVANIKRKAEILNVLNPSEILNLLILFVDSNVEYAVIELLLKAGANPKYWFQVVDSNVEYANIELLVKVGGNPKYRFQVPTYETELKQKKFFFLKQVWGQTPLHVAVRNGRVDLCDLLILYGAEVDGINLNKETPLFTAIKANNSEMVKCLLENGANPNCSQFLHHAVSEGKQNLCQLLISYGANVDAINMNRETPLVTAILANNSGMVKYLLESGANPNCAQCPFGVLHAAVRRRRANLCQLLISYGAKVDALNAYNTTPLVEAIDCNDLDMVKYLLESGADPSCAQCLHHAVSKGKQNLCQLLISYGANVDEINMNCETPLVTAILANNSHMIKYLLESGANPNFAQCLHHAAQKGRADICRLLFSYGADLNTMNANNETPLMLAIKSASHLPLDGPDRWLHRLNRQMATVKYLIYQQIHCNVNVSSESLLLVLSMVNRCLSDRPFAQCQTLKDACRQAIIKQNKDTDLSRVYKCMKSLDIPSCLVSYLFYEEQLNFLWTLPREEFIDLLKETDKKI